MKPPYTIRGNNTSGLAKAEDVACTAAGFALLDDADSTAQRATLGLGSAATSNTGDFAPAVHTHDDRYYTESEIDALLGDLDPVWGTITGTLSNQTDLQAALDAKAPTANPTFTGTVTIPDGALAIADTSGLQTALDAKQPLDSDLTTIAGLTATTNNFMASAASAWASLTPTQATALLNVFTDALKGLVPASGGGTTNFLRADGTFAAPTATAGDLAKPETGSLTVATAKYHITACRHQSTGSQQIVVAGTGRLRIQN